MLLAILPLLGKLPCLLPLPSSAGRTKGPLQPDIHTPVSQPSLTSFCPPSPICHCFPGHAGWPGSWAQITAWLEQEFISRSQCKPYSLTPHTHTHTHTHRVPIQHPTICLTHTHIQSHTQYTGTYSRQILRYAPLNTCTPNPVNAQCKTVHLPHTHCPYKSHPSYCSHHKHKP